MTNQLTTQRRVSDQELPQQAAPVTVATKIAARTEIRILQKGVVTQIAPPAQEMMIQEVPMAAAIPTTAKVAIKYFSTSSTLCN
jgi:hypothetical protein